jgi:hypothetical protein
MIPQIGKKCSHSLERNQAGVEREKTNGGILDIVVLPKNEVKK